MVALKVIGVVAGGIAVFLLGCLIFSSVLGYSGLDGDDYYSDKDEDSDKETLADRFKNHRRRKHEKGNPMA